MTIEIRPIGKDDTTWVRQFSLQEFNSTRVVSRGVLHQVDHLPGFVAFLDGVPSGLLTYQVAHGAMEVVTLHAAVPGKGLGSRLLEAARRQAVALACRRLWLITTNDNTPAIHFYQHQGLRVVAVHHNAVVESRRIKPEIPEIGVDGQPICDEVEFELDLVGQRVPNESLSGRVALVTGAARGIGLASAAGVGGPRCKGCAGGCECHTHRLDRSPKIGPINKYHVRHQPARRRAARCRNDRRALRRAWIFWSTTLASARSRRLSRSTKLNGIGCWRSI